MNDELEARIDGVMKEVDTLIVKWGPYVKSTGTDGLLQRMVVRHALINLVQWANEQGECPDWCAYKGGGRCGRCKLEEAVLHLIAREVVT